MAGYRIRLIDIQHAHELRFVGVSVYVIKCFDIIKSQVIKEMYQLNRIGFVSSLLVIFLLPLFFLPTQIVPLGLAKSSLLLLSSIIVFVAMFYTIYKEKKVSLPNTYIILAALLLPIVYTISSLGSKTLVLSIFGYALEVGTAGSIVTLSILFVGAIYFFRDRAKLIRAITALFLSLSIVAVFALLKVFFGASFLTLNTFYGKMGNPVGAWTDLSVIFGVLAIVTVFTSEMLPLSGRVNMFVRALFIISVLLLVVTNFSTLWGLTLVSSLILLAYFGTVEKLDGVKFTKRIGVRLAIILAVISLIFLVNPKLGSKDIATRISEISGVVNSDVRPNLQSTFDVTQRVLSSNLLLGSGPNTFDKSWLLYKSSETNATPFWNLSFPYGFGFLPTVPSSVGIIGSLVWVIFLGLFLKLGIKSLSQTQESRSDKFLLISTFLVATFLWTAVFIYPPSIVVLGLAFITTGLFVASTEVVGAVSSKEIILNSSRLNQFASALVAILLIVGVGSFGFVSAKKVLAATHFQRALVYANTSTRTLTEVESELGKAITISPSDPFWSAVSQVQLIKVNNVMNNPSGNDDTDRDNFQNALSAGIAALQNAINLNPSYQNWIALGNIYSSLVPEPISIDGAYESAQTAYKQAQSLHPLSPEASLLLARLEYDNNNAKAARSYIAEAISKKSDYAEAYYFLSQLEVGENNLKQAIESAETSALLLPTNAGVLFQLGLLKYSNREYKGAIEAFNRSLALVSDYANAKYYLALSLDRTGKTGEAIKILEDLDRTNPNNSAVEDALDRIRDGKTAESETKSKTSKTTPPIQGQ